MNFPEKIKLEVKKKRSKVYNQFGEIEWPKADMEHYGKSLDWKKKHFYLLAKEGKKVTGTLHFNIDLGVVYIESLLIAQDCRGSGIGKLLMERAEDMAKEQKAHMIYLKTGRGWVAENFYKKLGFQETGILKNHCNHRDFVIFSKEIGQ